MVDISVLENEADGKVIHNVLTELRHSNELQLIDVMILIKYVIPVYPSLSKDTQNVLLSLVSQSNTFLAQLVSVASSLSKDLAISKIYKRVLKELLLRCHDCLKNYIRDCASSKIGQRSLKAVLFGSRLFNVLSSDVDIVWYLERLSHQWAELFKMPINYFKDKMFAEYVISMFNLHPALSMDLLFRDLYFSNINCYRRFKEIIDCASWLDRQTIVKKFVLPFLDLNTEESNCEAVYVLLRDFRVDDMADLQTILQLKSLLLQEVVLLLLEKNSIGKITIQLINNFGDVDDLTDENVCQLLVMLLKYRLNGIERRSISNDSKFLESVTERLKNPTEAVRERTMFIAMLVTEGELKYESEFTLETPEPNFVNNKDMDSDMLNIVCQPEKNAQHISSVLSNIRELDIDKNSDDEDENESHYTTAGDRDIVFIKDLVRAYETHSKEGKMDLVPLFKLTVKLVRQKRHLPIEVNFYSASLITNIACANNNHEESKFEEWRMNALVAIIVITPEKVVDLSKILFTSELSLQQRVSLLTSMGLAARELKGYDDASIVKPQYDFPTKTFPWDVGASRIQDVATMNNDSLISSGTAVWKSKKLHKDPQPQKRDFFRPYAAKFFYPLAHAWLNGINLGTYDQLFKTHYLTTLAIIYQCAFPVHDYESMTQLMNQVFMDASQQGLELPLRATP